MDQIDRAVLERLVEDLTKENSLLREKITSLEVQLDDALCGTGGCLGECGG